MMTQVRPQPGEYAQYYEKYIALVPQEDVLEVLDAQMRDLRLLLERLTPRQADFRYASGKWSIKQTVGHINDSERIFA